ncbi:MAG: uracil-DNA glycosylase [Clostridia bacterium]|nr:uracil-DNA glycosylase [Clostridia bacterium]
MDQRWEQLKRECERCRACGLCEARHHVVFGVGNPQAEVLFIGEGPGENEDLRGEPFVGRGGQLLDTMLEAVGLSRKHNIYIANTVKCRPPKNRDPLPEEQDACGNWLKQQMNLISPRIVVCLGRIAAFRMISPDFKVTKQHGQFFEKDGVLYMGMFHPAAILRNPHQKPEAFADFLKLRDKIEEICTHTELRFDD